MLIDLWYYCKREVKNEWKLKFLHKKKIFKNEKSYKNFKQISKKMFIYSLFIVLFYHLIKEINKFSMWHEL